MTPKPPLIDKRTSAELARDTETLLRQYLELKKGDVPHAGLVPIFARLAELVVERLNRVPEKNFLAFLDLIGVSPLPAQPARVPLTFTLAAGATEAVVPARTPVAALPLGGEDEPPTFQTETELLLTRSDLVAAFVREPDQDQFADVTDRAAGRNEADFPAFKGDRATDHALCVGDASFAFEPAKTIVVHIEGREGEPPWPHAVDWSRWDGTGWVPLQASLRPQSKPLHWQVEFGDVPPIPPKQIGNATASWLRGTLAERLRQGGLAPDAAFSDNLPLPAEGILHPFGEATATTAFYLGCERAFSKPGAEVRIQVAVDEALAVVPPTNLKLAWEYWDGKKWQSLAGFDDTTEKLTKAGHVSFVAPTDWAKTDWPKREHVGVNTYWLRIRVDAGDYGEPRPRLVRLALEYAWSGPCIVGVKVEIERKALAPEAALANGAPVDLDKDFLPFGAEPRFNDTFYIAAEPFSRPGAKVTLDLEPTNPATENAPPQPAVPSDGLELQWEYWNATQQTWDALAKAIKRKPKMDETLGPLEDGTGVFEKKGSLKFTIPAGAAPREVGGQLRSWIRVRIAKGNYGKAATYEVTGEDQDHPYKLVPASFRPPWLRSLRVSYKEQLARPEAIVTENDFQTDTIVLEKDRQTAGAAAHFRPFRPFRPTADADPALYLGFERPGEMQAFANRPTSLFLSVLPALFEPARPSGETELPAITWEYWNGHWTRLPVIDETRAQTRSGAVRFIGPADLRASSEFGRTASWLRVRCQGGRLAPPTRLRRVLTNTEWATHAVRVADEVLGSSTGEPGQTFATARTPVLPGERIEVCEAWLPTASERAHVELAPVGPALGVVAARPPGEVWVRWKEVPDFYGSRPWDRHYVLDRLAGRVRFGDGQRGLVPPAGRANVRATYETGGGEVGNRPPNNVTQLATTVPYVNAARNLEAAAGGADRESLESVLERGPKILRHRDRAIAASDVEDLAFEASPAVARARAVPARKSKDAGRVGVVVVARSDEPQPVPSVELLTRVEHAIRARMPVTADVWVAGPGWLRIDVHAEIVPVSLEQSTNAETAIRARLAAFLHPLTGGPAGRGWDFGRRPHRSHVFALIAAVPGVDHVRTLRLVEQRTLESPAPEAFLVHSGHHTLTLAGRDA